MPTLTHSVEIDPTRFRYLTQDKDGEVYAHKDKPDHSTYLAGWNISSEDCDYVLTGSINKDYANSLVDLRKPFTFIDGILKQMEEPK